MTTRGKSTAKEEPVRQSVTLPARLARQVRGLARAQRKSANRVLVDLIEAGIDSRNAEKQHFLDLVERLAESTDTTEQMRIKSELAHLTFGS